MSKGDGGPPRVRRRQEQQQQQQQQQQQHHLTKSLFVDCSVEYELPNIPKLDGADDGQRLLVIHPNPGIRQQQQQHLRQPLQQHCPHCPPLQLQQQQPPRRASTSGVFQMQPLNGISKIPAAATATTTTAGFMQQPTTTHQMILLQQQQRQQQQQQHIQNMRGKPRHTFML